MLRAGNAGAREPQVLVLVPGPRLPPTGAHIQRRAPPPSPPGPQQSPQDQEGGRRGKTDDVAVGSELSGVQEGCHPGRPGPGGALDRSAAGRRAQAVPAAGARLLRRGATGSPRPADDQGYRSMIEPI